jgi:dihydrofolate reductase
MAPLKAGTSGEGDRIQTDLLETCDIVLTGRRTYDVMAPAWSARSGDPYSDGINTMRKVVVSTALTDPQWANTEVVAGDVARVRDLRGEDGGNIVQYGFGDVSRLLLDNGLFDQLQLWIHPQLVGRSDAADLVSPRHDGDVRARGLEGPQQRDHPGDLPVLTPEGRHRRSGRSASRQALRRRSPAPGNRPQRRGTAAGTICASTRVPERR